MILDKFHIAQRYAVAERHAHTVTGDDAAVGVVAVNPARAACCHHYRVSSDLHERAASIMFIATRPRVTVIDQNIGRTKCSSKRWICGN